MIKKILILFVALIATTQMLWADEVTPEEAIRKAQNFMRQRQTSGARQRKAQATSPRLTPTQQVCGLYVFNVADEGGYVIVSNDDRTIPVLGYSDNGHLDPDDMPDNMKAWLEGYAREIECLDDISGIATMDVPAKVGNHATTTLDPLVTTQWSQHAPYSDRCPRESSTNKRCVTGCVATAMAQVMNYHKWPESPTTEIPGYDWSEYIDTQDPLPVITFDWDNMKDTYTGEEPIEDPTAIAVSTLMRYCGQSVRMQYSPSGSGAYTMDVAPALETYFGYNESAQYLVRSYYSYANWTDLIYNELEQGRPVIYDALARDAGGHAFVCDGYMYEGGEDLFHINWGWGGALDGYFVLSVLDASEEKGLVFDLNQGAIVGIQKPGDTGTVLDVKKNTVDLAVSNVSLSAPRIVLGNSVNVSFSVTNNSEDDYDGYIAIAYEGILGDMDKFELEAGSTTNQTIKFTPRKSGRIKLYINIPLDNGTGSYRRVTDATTLVVLSTDEPVVLLNDDSAQPEGSKNTDVIESNVGKTVDVTLSGRTFYKDGSWNTLCLPFDLTCDELNEFLDDPEEMKMLTGTSFDNGTLTLTFKNVSKLQAGMPYLIRWNNDTENPTVTNPEFRSVTISDETDGVETECMDFVGSMSSVGFMANDRTKLFLGEANKLYYPNANMMFNAFRGYFQLSEGLRMKGEESLVKAFKLDLDGDSADGIGSIHNSQLPLRSRDSLATPSAFIIHNEVDAVYDLNGRKINSQFSTFNSQLKKGIYIHNGKKIFVK